MGAPATLALEAWRVRKVLSDRKVRLAAPATPALEAREVRQVPSARLVLGAPQESTGLLDPLALAAVQARAVQAAPRVLRGPLALAAIPARQAPSAPRELRATRRRGFCPPS